MTKKETIFIGQPCKSLCIMTSAEITDPIDKLPKMVFSSYGSCTKDVKYDIME